ncbi:MAG: HlyD family secretion protein [Acidimicrobiales bacterium]
MTVDTKVEKVRGMNASLTNGSAAETESGKGNPLAERDPTRLHITRRQMAFALALSVAAVLATVFTVNSVTAAAQSFPAVVTTSKVYDLNFTNSGTVSAVLVKVGDRVKANQVLATQEDSSLQMQLSADQATVKADREVLVQAASPGLTPAQVEQDDLQVQQAQTALTNAQAGLQSAEASGKANVGAAQSAITSAQAQESSDNGTYTQACPNGPVAPDPSLSGTQLQAAQSAFTHCQNLQLSLSGDQAAASKAQAQLPVAEAEAQQAIDAAQATVNSAQAALNVADYQQTLQGSPGSASSQAQAQANLNQAESQLAQVQSEVTAATLVAPDGGVVTEVYGTAGETLGPDGVHIYQSPAAIPANQSSGFSLFPSQPSSQGTSSSNQSGSEPVIEVVGGRQQIMAQVPEAQVASVQVGKSATITISSLNITASGVVTQLGLSPTRSPSGVTYDVIVDLNRTVSGLLPGMTATVRF